MAVAKKPISISLDHVQLQRLEYLSKKTRIPRSVLVREGVDAVLDKYEAQYSLQLPDGPKTKGLER